jgi:hypothetical protein
LAERGIEEVDATDPVKLALDARLTAVLEGAAVKSNGERLQLAYHGYERNRHVASARLFAEALEREPNLANDRQRQHPYNAACAAALAALQPDSVNFSSADVSSPPVGANHNEGAEKLLAHTERCKLRNQARSWLRAELGRWAKLLESANEQQRALIAATLKHWLEDHDLISVRDTSALDSLPDGEQRQWRRLWEDVGRLFDSAASGSPSRGSSRMPNSTDAFARR